MRRQHAIHQMVCPTDGGGLCYSFLRHVGLILDELSAQGLEVWLDPQSGWRWQWREGALEADKGFWALGEAVVDAVVARYPQHFDDGLIDIPHHH
jgi:hypothetical protein